MSKISVKLVMIGHIDKIIDFDVIKNHKSNLFKVEELHRISDLPLPEIKGHDLLLSKIYREIEIYKC